MKTRLLLTIAFIPVMFIHVYSQWTYTDLSVARGYMGSAAIGTKAYFAGGNNSVASVATVESYDVVQGSWEIVGDLIVPREVISGVACGTKVYFAGGFDWTASYDLVEIYDTETEEWSFEQLSVPRFSMAAVTCNNKVFFAGGFQFPQQSYKDVVDVYDSQTGLWETKQLSLAREGIAATVAGDLVFFAGGKNFAGTTNLVDIYNISTDSWTVDTLSQARGFASAAAIGNKVIIAGGITSLNNTTDRVDIYDISTGEWDTASLSDPRCSQGNAAALNGLAYFAGGGNFMGSGYYDPSDVIDIYDPLNNSWSIEHLSEPVVAHSVLSAGNFLVIAGGETNGGVVVSVVELLETSGVGVIETANHQSAVSCFPNPTSGNVTFQWTTDNGQWTMLKIYNAQGQEVATVFDETLPAGEHTITWNAECLPSGIYYYRLTTNDQRSTTGKIVKN